LLAQSKLDQAKATADSVGAVAAYCDNVESHSDARIPRIFARVTSAFGQSSGWVEYDSRAAWNRAGTPQPVALVWYRDAKIVRVAITPNEADQKPEVYADYCYREDGSLARLRSMPSVERDCKRNRYQCSLVVRQERLYPPEGPAVRVLRYLDGVGYVANGTAASLGAIGEESLQPERTIVTFAPMKWPEYMRVADLPFSELLYATLR
jgi:hypothetical protein